MKKAEEWREDKKRREKTLLELKADNKQWLALRQLTVCEYSNVFIVHSAVYVWMFVCILTGVQSLSCLSAGAVGLNHFQYLSILL